MSPGWIFRVTMDLATYQIKGPLWQVLLESDVDAPPGRVQES